MPPESSKADKVIAMFDIAGFTSIPAPIAPADLLDVLQEYLDTVFQMVESSGGTARHLNGNAVVGIWPVDTAPLSRERIGRAIVEVLVRVPTLALPGGLRCVPAVGVASGPILHASLSVAGKKIPVSLGESMNLAMRLSSSCSAMKKRILFPTSLPVIWPPSVEVEEVTPIIVKGMAGQVQLASLKEKEANPPLQTPASRMPAAGV